uniref:ABC transporter domain-containing protein n=1 Tax=Oryza barthii TaxID=65489 RepID=A0A0D3GZY7_9ORYZ
MADTSSSSRGAAGFATQANALLRKNLCFQRRNMKTNACITVFPVFLCVILVVLQGVINHEINKPKYQCGCACVDAAPDGTCRRTECGVEHSTLDQVGSCPIQSPTPWPALVQVPRPESRAVRIASQPFDGLPDPTCRDTGSCPASVLITGMNRSLAQSLSGGLFPAVPPSLNFTDYLDSFSKIVAGSDTWTWTTQFIEPGILYMWSNLSVRPIYHERFLTKLDLYPFNSQGGGSGGRKTNEFIAGYDFLNTNNNGLEINIWYNSTYNNNTAFNVISLLRVPRLVNTASNAYMKFLRGSGVEMLLEYVKDMPKVGTKPKFDLSSLLGALFFTWIIELLFPVILTYLVYEKQQKLKIMMKMHGLKDEPYWMISYSYFFALSAVYMIVFVLFGSLIGLNFFKTNNYGIQFVFYFIYINLQIALAFFIAAFFSSVKTATEGWIVVMEIIPGFSLYRGLYELGQYAFSGNAMGTNGMEWTNLSDSENGMRIVLIIMVVEWAILLPLAFYLDKISSLGSGAHKTPMFFLKRFKNRAVSLRRSFGRQGSKVVVEMDNPDVSQEREVVEQLLLEPNANQAIICNNLKKVYHGKDGNPDKLAVRGLSLALPKGQCFGMLGPNGAGKTSFISMMIGLIPPTSGTALVHGMDINTDMDSIYTNMGVCPQHDLLWETLTGKEHLLFYGRLKNLKGAELEKAVDDSLKSVNLFHGGVGNKQVGKYSGGMKRRLSVAISLIGDPKVVFMDEPSTGLDPASRNNLWNVVKEAKKNRAIILTTHSMEEAEVLCDRLGIFVDGGFQCLGNPKELKARYGGTYVFTMTTSSEHEQEVKQLVQHLSPSANRIYHISGTQKFELPKQEVKIADVFHAVERAKRQFSIHAWGLVDTTLEDVFIKVAKGAQGVNVIACAVPAPPRWPAVTQVPDTPYRALTPLHPARCRSDGGGGASEEPCPVAALEGDFSQMSLLHTILGTSTLPAHVLFIEPGFVPNSTLYVIQRKCIWDSHNTSGSSDDAMPIQLDVKCVQGLSLWCRNSAGMNDHFYKGYKGGNKRRTSNEYLAGYDFLDTSKRRFHVYVSYNSTFSRDNGHHPMTVLRVARLVNMASTTYLKFLRGPNVEMRLEYLKEMPKAAMKIRLDLTTLLDALFFTWTVQLLLPVMLTYLVYEKQHNLRLMMKMHGLKDGPYWMISHAYFLSLSAAYMMFFVMFGSLIGLDIFRLNSYSIQFVFYFLYINLQIVLAFLLASFFSSVKTASVISYIYVFGSSLLGEALLQLFIEDITFPRQWLVTMELVPGFALYRGFYELAEYAFSGRQMGKPGMQWRDLNDPINGMKDVLLLMSIEWILLLPVAFLLDHRPTWHPLFLFGFMSTKHSSPTLIPDKVKQRSRKVFADMAKPDVFLERKVVKKLLKEMDMRNMIICHNLKKVYPGKNGNPDKLAVKGLSLALRKGQCFGMLGPNGAGKTSFINMMIGLVAPTYGTAYIHGMDLRRDMNEIYANIGVCPQHDLLWETLTGREHLMFYGRLKNLTGAALLKAVDESLKSVNLFHSGFGDKSVNKYSGGMKRRLSVAIALIGNPKVVYMDEPSTGLDTTSRSNLWNVIKRAKKNCTIILTTHSMEEAEELCDRVGIFVDGNFQCLGTPKELKARYGGVRALTITTAAGHEEAVERAVARRCPGAAKVYGVGGTQRFEVPRRGARLDGVLGAVEAARRAAPVVAWGVADATLEDVFVRVAMDARAAAHVLS